MKRATAGFTLVEVLVVMMIVAILAASVVLGFMGADREQNLRTEAERLAALIELARTQSLSRNEEWGLALKPDGYTFMVYEPERNRWVEQNDSPFRPRTVAEATLSAKVEAIKVPDDDKKGDRPAILILSSGEQTPFEIEVVPGWQTRSWFVTSDGLSRTVAERAP